MSTHDFAVFLIGLGFGLIIGSGLAGAIMTLKYIKPTRGKKRDATGN